MDVEEQVERLLSKKSFSSNKVREKTRQALLKTLRPINAINETSVEDDELDTEACDDYQNKGGVYRNDDSDGVPCVTLDHLQSVQDAKTEDLRSKASGFFSYRELAPTATIDTGVNAKLKWGYTLLHFAAIEGDDVECCRLVDAGASRSVLDNSGKMAWQKAELKGHFELAAKLKP